MGEVPLVIVDVQRMGPATGGATTPGQGDVQFARWGNSGGYPIVALAPGSVYECYSLTRTAFDLAERFRCPVFLLTDKELFQAMTTVDVDGYEAPAVRERVIAGALAGGTSGLRSEETYIPYRIASPDAVPEYAPIGGPHIVRFTGSTHDEHGFLTKDPAKVGRLNEHLRRKIDDHAAELDMARAAPVGGATTAFISYGVTTAAMEEAREASAHRRNARLHPSGAEPVAGARAVDRRHRSTHGRPGPRPPGRRGRDEHRRLPSRGGAGGLSLGRDRACRAARDRGDQPRRRRADHPGSVPGPGLGEGRDDPHPPAAAHLSQRARLSLLPRLRAFAHPQPPERRVRQAGPRPTSHRARHRHRLPGVGRPILRDQRVPRAARAQHRLRHRHQAGRPGPEGHRADRRRRHRDRRRAPAQCGPAQRRA